MGGAARLGDGASRRRGPPRVQRRRSPPMRPREAAGGQAIEGIEDILRGAQELDSVIKQGYLEKKSKDHSFFGSEWQKRWCVISRGLFLYYANEKSKQPKGTFLIKGYSVRMAPHLRKDSKKESCFELISQDRRSYEWTMPIITRAYGIAMVTSRMNCPSNGVTSSAF